MQYYKVTNERGFVTASTINADGEGNSTQSEHDTLVEMYRNAPDGYGVVETESGFEYAPFPPEPDDHDPPDNLDASIEYLMSGHLIAPPTEEADPDYLNEHEPEPDYFE